MIWDFSDYLAHCQQRVQTALPLLMTNIGSEYADDNASHSLQNLADASVYSLLNGGKRVRATL
ncbi:MAG: hypothetical protein ACI9BO_001209, partial [Zhongshania sp.]